MNISEGINAYKTYLAIKQHFTSKYDYKSIKVKLKLLRNHFLKEEIDSFLKNLKRNIINKS